MNPVESNKILHKNSVDLTGRKFGRLTVLNPTDERRRGNIVWECLCDCGKKCKKPSISLNTGTKSCGCLQKEVISKYLSLDLTGRKFGRLTCLYKTTVKWGSWLWKCKCDCGKEIETTGRELKYRPTASCGCWEREITSKNKIIDLTGRKFGRLTVLSQCGRTKKQSVLWLCQCDCGNKHTTSSPSLIGGTQSCGCYRLEQLRKKMSLISHRNEQTNNKYKSLAEVDKLKVIKESRSYNKYKNMVGMKFGKLTVIEPAAAGSLHFKDKKWKCKCDCGNEKVIKHSYLVVGSTKSCGCLHRETTFIHNEKQKLQLLGSRFGKLTVIESAGSNGRNSIWKCQCDCGKIKTYIGSTLIYGRVFSCGCYAPERSRMTALDPKNRQKMVMSLQLRAMKKKGQIVM